MKPTWWPKNPYPESIFPMPRKKYPDIVPDPDIRTALSGMLGREFWEIASESILCAMQNNMTEIIESFDEPEKSVVQKALGIIASKEATNG